MSEPPKRAVQDDLAGELARLERSSVLGPSNSPEGDLLRALLAILPVGVIAYDAERIHYANACAHQLLGADPESSFGVSDIFRFIDPEDWPRVEARRSARMRGERTPRVEVRMVHADGRRLDVSVETVDLRAMPERLFLTILQDVTEQRRGERERRDAEARRQHEVEALLETQKLESLGVLTGGIAHDP